MSPLLAMEVGTWSLGERMRGAPPRGADLSAFCWLTMFWKAAWLLAAIMRCVFSSPAIKSKSVSLKINAWAKKEWINTIEKVQFYKTILPSVKNYKRPLKQKVGLIVLFLNYRRIKTNKKKLVK
jgi:hypothetical protein